MKPKGNTMTEKETFILIRDSLKDLKINVQAINEKFDNHMAGACSTQKQLDKHEELHEETKKNHKWILTTAIAVGILIIKILERLGV